MPNSLTTEASLKLGAIVIETFFKHYLERNSESSKATGPEGSGSTTLREQDLLWQESFEIIKSFLNQATKHTVEELQEFSNARIPVAPWIYVKRVLVPLTICDKAAEYLIKAFGGDAATKRVVGGTKWWQVRGMRGVDCQWICQKSQMRTSRKLHKARESRRDSGVPVSPSSMGFSTFRKFSNQLGNCNPDKLGRTREGSRSKSRNDSQSNREEKEASLEGLAGVDGTRCMLYAHGGGYYFGSIDQERYCLQRYARKMQGRVFAVNYRLAPQYPFPCAIQDMVAAYLYLIDPPLEATHAPIPPNQVVLGGDSAGGGLCLAILQVMRDSGIPLPAAAVLISPWCDLTHSFPSLLQNTKTDIIPPYGLCLHKPSVLWPPPPDEISSVVRRGLRERFKAVARRALHGENSVTPSDHPLLPQIAAVHVEANERTEIRETTRTDTTSQPLVGSVSPIPSKNEDRVAPDVNSDAPDMPTADYLNPIYKSSGTDSLLISGRLPLPWEPLEKIELHVDDKRVIVDSQIQLYCPNNLLTHPFISPVLGYLGGLPPLLIIASDKEVLRDEIIYVAHKAAHPDQYPIHDDSRSLYPPLQHLPTPYRPTPVHLQVYDDTAHVLPLFSFTTPAKYCYRAIAQFTRHLTAPSIERPELKVSDSSTNNTLESKSPSNVFLEDDSRSPISNMLTLDLQRQYSPTELSGFSSVKGFQPADIGQHRSEQRHQTTVMDQTDITTLVKEDSGDVAGSRFKTNEAQPQGPGTAGNPSVYADTKWPTEPIMIRERVSTNGVLRPLEAESEMPILTFPSNRLGRINEGVARRYLKGQGLWAKKFGQTTKKIETLRKKNLEAAKCETIRTVESIAQLQEHLFSDDVLETDSCQHKKTRTRRKSLPSLQEADVERQRWTWAWALDDEHPPSSSIVSRRDTAEARRLARVADLSVEQEESKLSGNMLWSVLVNFLTVHPKHKQAQDDDDGGNDEGRPPGPDDEAVRSQKESILQRLKSFGGKPTGSLAQDASN